jgi:very-short-patch-repair endonuclease
MKHQSPTLTLRARAMRRQPSAAENKLWQALRSRQLDGFKFVRQEPIGPYIADFICRSCRLVIEVDGETHEGEEAQAYDARRSAFMVSRGYRVMRIANEDVLGDLGPALEEIVRWLK